MYINQRISKIPDKMFLVLSIFLVLIFVQSQSFAKEIGGLPKYLKAVIPPDNDLSLTDTPHGIAVEIPSKVKTLIHKLAQKTRDERVADCKNDTPEECSYFASSYFYGPVFRIQAPENRFLFIFKTNDIFESGKFNLMIYDPKSDRVTKQPVGIYYKWMTDEDGMLEKPIVSFDDLDQGGEPQLVIEDRHHNGTMVNYVSYTYFRIESDLSLTRNFELDTRWIDLNTDGAGLIVRKIIKLDPGSIRVETFLQLPGKNDKKLGENVFVQKNQRERFVMQSSSIIDPKYNDFFTFSNETREQSKENIISQIIDKMQIDMFRSGIRNKEIRIAIREFNPDRDEETFVFSENKKISLFVLPYRCGTSSQCNYVEKIAYSGILSKSELEEIQKSGIKKTIHIPTNESDLNLVKKNLEDGTKKEKK